MTDQASFADSRRTLWPASLCSRASLISHRAHGLHRRKPHNTRLRERESGYKAGSAPLLAIDSLSHRPCSHSVSLTFYLILPFPSLRCCKEFHAFYTQDVDRGKRRPPLRPYSLSISHCSRFFPLCSGLAVCPRVVSTPATVEQGLATD